MNKYRNKETGAVIEIKSILTSDYWEPVVEKQPVPSVKKPVKRSAPKKKKEE